MQKGRDVILVTGATGNQALMFEWFDRVGYEADIEANGKKYAVTPTSLEEWAKGADWS